MEKNILKLVAEVGLLALIVWLVAAAAGEKGKVSLSRPKAKRMSPRSQVWNQSPVQAPSASPGLLFTPIDAV